MTLYIGVDFHPHQQTVSYCRSDESKVHQASLVHNIEQVRRFYKQLPKAVVGIEASCTAQWFEQLLSELGHELRVGNPTAIRARAQLQIHILETLISQCPYLGKLIFFVITLKFHNIRTETLLINVRQLDILD